MIFDDSKTIYIHHSVYGLVYCAADCKDEEEAWQAYLDDNRHDIENGYYEHPDDTTFDRTYHRWMDKPDVEYDDCHEFARKGPIVMADPGANAPSAPLPDAPEPRVSPADQMAVLEGGPVEPLRPEQDEPKEPRAEAKPAGANRTFPEMAPFDAAAPAAKARTNDPQNSARPKASDTAQTPVSPAAPAAPAGAAGPQATNPASPSPQVRERAGEVSRGPQGGAPMTGPAVIAAALTGGLRRADAAPVQSVPASDDARATAPRSLLDRLALKSILDNLRRQEPQPAGAPAAPAASAATPANPARSAANAAGAAIAAGTTSAPPSGGLRDKLAAFTAERMQPRREAEQMRGAARSGATVLASLDALERQETAGVLERIRDAAKANGGIERVLSEMRPGGAFEDLRKEFNTALSYDEGFAAAYHKAATALSGYAETRAAMTTLPRADPNLARLETLDREIGAAVKALPGVEGGKSALDEALERSREAAEKTFSVLRQAFSRDADLRGPSPSPSFGP